MAHKAEVEFVDRHLISTLDKKETLATLRTWRDESQNKDEATVLGDFIKLVASGELDG